MNKISKKFALLPALFAAIIMMTGCPMFQQTNLPAEETCVVTFYPQQGAQGVALTVEKGDTLTSLADKVPAAIISDEAFKFISWVTADGKEFAKDKPITSNVSLYAKFGKTTVNENTQATETQTTNGSSSTVTTTTTTKEDGTQVVETTETATDSQGNTTTTETTTTTDAEGNPTVVETVTDPDGTKTTVVTPPDNMTVHKLIELGLKALSTGNINLGKSYFNAAYEKDPADDEALLYSAISDLSSIATNPGIRNFFKNHVGIMDYPSNLDDLITGGWLTSTQYEVEGKYSVWSYKIDAVENPEPYGTYYYRAKLTDKSETEDNVFSIPQYSCYTTMDIKGKKYVVSMSDKLTCDTLKQGTTKNFFGSNSFYYSSESRYLKFELDNEGDYFISVWQDEVPEGSIAYKMDWDGQERVKFTYPVTCSAPKFNSLEDQSWFEGTLKDSEYMSKLLSANILHGNVNGLDSAIDDLYSALFESDEYKNACKKIAAIKNGVAIPEIAVQAFNLGQTLGTSEVVIGATELTLIKDVLNIFKGTLEYLQSYSYSYDLSVLEEKWDDFANKEKYESLLELVASYNASVDPIANGFLSVRSAEKIAASKNTFLGIVNDVIASYDNLVAADSGYPDVVKGFLGDYTGIRDTVVAAKEALENGTNYEFDISGMKINVDFGKLFTAGQFALDNLIEIAETTEAPAPKAPVLYTVNQSGAFVKVADAEAFVNAMKAGQSIFIHLKAINAAAEVTDALSFAFNGAESNFEYVPLPMGMDAYLFNFYYGGLEAMFAEQETPGEAQDPEQNTGN